MSLEENANSLISKFRDENYYSEQDCKSNSISTAILVCEHVLSVISQPNFEQNEAIIFWANTLNYLSDLQKNQPL
jgi:hypothetical protein